MPGPGRAPARGGWLLWLMVSSGLLLVVGAHIHLVYMAFESHPGCVAHLKNAASEPGQFRAAKSDC